jgi:hypothetical protein
MNLYDLKDGRTQDAAVMKPTATENVAAEQNPGSASQLRSALRYFHWAATALLLVLFIPAFHRAGLPFNINWSRFFGTYWGGLMVRSVCAAAVLYVLGFPLRETLIPLWENYRRQRGRFVVLAVFAAYVLWWFGWWIGLMLIVDTVAFLEFFDRISGDPAKLARAAKDIAIPAGYFFLGLVLVFCYNDVIASLEFVGKYSYAYNRLDSVLLGGYTISQIAHAVAQRVPVSTFSFLELIYFGMFGQVGATIILIAMKCGRKRTLTFVGTMLTAYYLSLFIFSIWPGMSPFTICPNHFSRFPHSLAIYHVQKVTILKPRLLWEHALRPVIDTDYFIAFPCMHIALPAIALWFVRPWKRIVVALAIYDAVLFIAILLLEQHYLVDLIGGLFVAAISIVMVHGPRSEASNNMSLSR